MHVDEIIVPGFKCTSCGSTEGVLHGDNVKCKYCGVLHKRERANDATFLKLEYAAIERQETRFGDAWRSYGEIIEKEESKDANKQDHAVLETAYFGKFLCEQRVLFYNNENSVAVPSFWEIEDQACTDSENFKKAIEHSMKGDRLNTETYRKQAEKIEEYKKKYRNIKKEDYDIFICFKNCTESHNLGYKIYNHFSRDYKVFFSPESLKGTAGLDFEPYIYNALKTSEVMFVLCSSEEDINSQWVRNEWWRFAHFTKDANSGYDRSLTPIFMEGFKTSHLPDDIRNCQGYSADVELMSNLTQHVEKHMQNVKAEVKATPFQESFNRISDMWQVDKGSEAQTQIDKLIREEIPTDHYLDKVKALYLRARIYSHDYKYMKNQAVKDSLAEAAMIAQKHKDRVTLNEIEEYKRYRSAMRKKGAKKTLVALLAAVLIAAGGYAGYQYMQDPMVDVYITGKPASIELEYGEGILSELSSLTTVSQKGKENQVELNSSMISGFDPTKIGVQDIVITYNGVEIHLSVNVVKYTLSAPGGISFLDGQITWAGVQKAQSYTLRINDEEIENIQATSYHDYRFSQSGVYTIQVKAAADNSVGMDSAYSQSITVAKLAHVSNLQREGLNLTWDAVANCNSYDIYINDTKVASSVRSSYTLSAQMLWEGENRIYVVPVGADNVKLKSELSEEELLDMENNGQITAQLVKLAHASNLQREGMNLIWDSVANCNSYDIYINDTKVATTDLTNFSLSKQMLFDGKNLIYVVPVGVENYKFKEDLSDAERVDPEHNSQVTLNMVELAQASNLQRDGMNLSWSNVDGCTDYDIYINGINIATTKSNTYTLLEQNLSFGENLVYVLPVGISNIQFKEDITEEEYQNREHNGELTFYRYKQAPGLRWDGSKLVWDEVFGATYALYINDVLMTRTESCSYVLENPLNPGQNDVYVIVESQPYITETPGQEYENNGVIQLEQLERVVGLRWSGGKLSWKAVSGATYAIYINGELIDRTTSNTYVPGAVHPGQNEVYVVVENAVYIADSGSTGSNTDVVYIKKLDKVTGITLTNKKLTWSTVDGAEEYVVMCNGVSVAVTKVPSYEVVLGGSQAINNTYTIQAVAYGDVLSSEVSDESITIGVLAVPTQVQVNGSNLSWNEVTNAKGYTIYVTSNGTTQTIQVDENTLNYNLLGKLEKGSYQIAVEAVGEGDFLLNSARSESVSYEVSETIIYISTEEELRKMVLDMEATYLLSNDITLTEEWTPIGTTAAPFVGRFNGNGYRIIDLTVTATSGQGTGFFGVIGSGGVVEELTIENASCSSSYGSVGIAVGINRGTVCNVIVYGKVTAETSDNVGGIVGRNYGSVYGCKNYASVIGKRYVGGIIGNCDISSFALSIYGCDNFGQIKGNSRVGGIMGNVSVGKKTTIYDMHNEGTVEATGEYAGGIFGYIAGSVGQTGILNSCSNSGSISAKDYAAGCFGYVGSYVTVVTSDINNPSLNCTNTGTVTTVDNQHVGDIYAN